MKLHSITIRQSWLDSFCPPVIQVHVARGLVLGTLRLHGVEADLPLWATEWRR